MTVVDLLTRDSYGAQPQVVVTEDFSRSVSVRVGHLVPGILPGSGRAWGGSGPALGGSGPDWPTEVPSDGDGLLRK